MDWKTLLCPQRARSTVSRSSGGRDLRSEFEKDYHRIIVSASFRRLQDKTQVFPRWTKVILSAQGSRIRWRYLRLRNLWDRIFVRIFCKMAVMTGLTGI